MTRLESLLRQPCASLALAHELFATVYSRVFDRLLGPRYPAFYSTPKGADDDHQRAR